MEFRLDTDLERSLPAVIDFNFEELKAELSTALAQYDGIILTANSLKTGKEERAKLNKLKTAIDEQRKEVKRRCLAPYEAFEAKCKELTGMVDAAASALDVQVKAFEDEEKETKRNALREVYDAGIGELAALVPFEKLLDPKWLNKSAAVKMASGELCAAMQKVANDAKVLRSMRLPCEDRVLDVYFNTLDMTAALAEKTRWEDRQAQLAQAAKNIRTVPGHGELTPEQAERVADLIETAMETAPSIPEDLKDVSVVFYATTAAFRAEMKAVTQKHNIKYGRA